MIKNDLTDLQPPQSKLNSIYRGIVEENNDPLKAGRCRVRVFGVHTAVKEQTTTTGVPTADLPWAEPALSIIEGSISNYGVWGVPLQGSHVFLFFENGNILNPRFFASAPGIPTTAPDTTVGFNDPDGVYPDKIDDPDYYSPKDSEYPECISFVTHGGHRIEVDNTPGNKRILIYHVSGTQFDVDNAGNITITGVSTEDENIASDKGTTIGGKLDLNVNGGNYNINVNSGNCDLTVSGDCNIDAGGNVNLDAGGNVNVNGSSIYLN